MTYDAICDNCGRVEIEKPMKAPFPLRHECGGKLKREWAAHPIQYNAPGFYTSDVSRFQNMVGPERYAKFEHQREDAERRAKRGQLTEYEKAL